MHIDGLTLSKIVPELKGVFLNQRVNKVFMPSESRFYFVFFKETLLVSLLPEASYLQIVPCKEDSPFFPPAFVMLLRKYLKGAICTDINQLGLDRVIRISFLNLTPEKKERNYSVYIELMGRNANLIFCDESGIIIDAFHRKTNSDRNLLPTNAYTPYSKEGPRLDQWNFLTGKEFLRQRSISINDEMSVVQFIESEFQGIGRYSSTEICIRAEIESDTRVSSLTQDDIENLNLVLNSVKEEISGTKKLYLWEKEERQSYVTAFYMHSLAHNGYSHSLKEPSEAIEAAFSVSRSQSEILRIKKRLTKRLEKEIRKVESNLDSMQTDLSETTNHDIYEKTGKLILTNLYRYGANAKTDNMLVDDWETGKKITIPLDPQISISNNAQLFFKKSTRLKRRNEILNTRIHKYEALLYYLQQILQSLNDADDFNSIQEIVKELEQESHFIRDDQVFSDKEKKIVAHFSNKKKKATSLLCQESRSQYRIFEKAGFKIFVGKNNYQNDRLIKDAKDGDYWFHTQGIPGSHVIVKNKNQPLPEEVLLFAARLAARFSKASQSTKVPVDYTDIKYVKKPKGFRPGMVVYREQKTLYVDPLSEKSDT
jgi:predicted ribosome quality control (RQC) complex YloA/Tae2 family protein